MATNPYTIAPDTSGIPWRAVLLAGLAGEVIFEIFALGVMPALTGQPMMPAGLVVALARTLLGLEVPMLVGWIGHITVGLVVFPLAYLVLRHATRLAWPLAGVATGICLWFIAQGILAPIIGRPFMLGFAAYSWLSLAAHLLFTMSVAIVLEWFDRT